MRIILFSLIFSFSFFAAGVGVGTSGDDVEENNKKESTSNQATHSTETDQVYQEPELHRAIRIGDLDLVMRALYSASVPGEENLIHARNSRGQSPLTLAVLLSRVNSIELLLARGVKLDLKNNVDQTALKYADSSVRKILREYNRSKSFVHAEVTENKSQVTILRQRRSFCQRIFRR